MSYYFWMITWMKNVNNLQIAKVQSYLAFAWFFANLSLAAFKVLLIQKTCRNIFLYILERKWGFRNIYQALQSVVKIKLGPVFLAKENILWASDSKFRAQFLILTFIFLVGNLNWLSFKIMWYKELDIIILI